MSKEILFALTMLAATGCGVVGGVFFAFSTFIMKALARISTESGVSAMQSINVAVIGPWFLSAFFGSGAVCVVMLVYSLIWWSETGSQFLLAGSLLYLVGTLLVTIAFNVPGNNRLAALSPAATETDREWASYISAWTKWNHVRTAASIGAAMSFCLSLAAAG